MDFKLLRLLEACRPNSDDLHSPDMVSVAEALRNDVELREFAGKMNHVDSAIGKAIRQVEPPSDLESKIKARLADQVVTRSEISSQHSIRRRRWLGLAIGMGGSAVCLVGVLAFWMNSNSMSQNDAITFARQARDQLTEDWIPLNAKMHRRLPIGLRTRPTGFQELDDGTIAFQYGNDRVLFVMSARGVGTIPAKPPRSPRRETGGWLFGVWKSPKYIYTLAVHGDVEDYQELIPLPPALVDSQNRQYSLRSV